MDTKAKILCIDDDDEICFALKMLFESQGWSASTCSDVPSGIKKFGEMKPDIVLIDYHMPGINGVDGVKMIRCLSATVPIIVFTIDESQEVADAFMDAGASDFALKPIKAPDIVSRIRLHLRLLGNNRVEGGNLDNSSYVKGISENIKNMFLVYLREQSEPSTAGDIAAGTGMSYQTVCRYLQYMTQVGLVNMESIYGKVGRPKQVYTVVE